MIKTILGFSFLLLSGCSTFISEVVNCPNITSPKGAAEVTVKSKAGLSIYMGIRGVDLSCTSSEIGRAHV